MTTISTIELSTIRFALSVLSELMDNTDIDQRRIFRQLMREFANRNKSSRKEIIDNVLDYLTIDALVEKTS
jgi:hypothetical protein